jgi:hypothetical protein
MGIQGLQGATPIASWQGQVNGTPRHETKSIVIPWFQTALGELTGDTDKNIDIQPVKVPWRVSRRYHYAWPQAAVLNSMTANVTLLVVPQETPQSVQGPGRFAFGAAPLQTGPPGAT